MYTILKKIRSPGGGGGGDIANVVAKNTEEKRITFSKYKRAKIKVKQVHEG
jgi:hypothetical protein